MSMVYYEASYIAIVVYLLCALSESKKRNKKRIHWK